MKIALLGKIPKGDAARENFVEWYQEYSEKLSEKIPEAEFLHGDLIHDKEGSEKVVGHDLWLIKHADVIVVDAREKIGAGTAQEIVLAKYFKKPVIAVIPKDTHHRRSNVVFDGVNIADWIHPFLDVSSDYIAESIEDAATWVKEFADNKNKQDIKDIKIFEESIKDFETGLPDVLNKYKKQGW